MNKLLTTLMTTSLLTVVGCFGVGAASADDTPAPPPPPADPGTAYALGGAHVMGIPYDEYIRRTGADWFPGLNREIVDYPAGQVQGHVLSVIPGIDELHQKMPEIGLNGPSIGESVEVGKNNVINRVQQGGPGTVIGLSEGAMVVHAVQDRLAYDPAAPPPNELSFATYGDPIKI